VHAKRQPACQYLTFFHPLSHANDHDVYAHDDHGHGHDVLHNLSACALAFNESTYFVRDHENICHYAHAKVPHIYACASNFRYEYAL